MRTIRWLGFAGALCCAADAVLFGAEPALRFGVSVASIARGDHGVVILLLWVAGLTALAVAWWRGIGAATRGELSVRWVLVTAAMWVLPVLAAPPLASRDMYAYACQGATWNAGLNPSVVGVSVLPCPWLDSVSFVWRDTPTPYGPLQIASSGLAAAFGSQSTAIVFFRIFAVLGLVLIAVGLPILARRRGASPSRALWLVLACPIVPVHLAGGGHNDALTVGLLVLGLALLAARSPRIGMLIAGGALIGAAVTVKTTIGVVLPFAALLAARGHLLRRGGAVVAGAVATMLALSFASGLGLHWFAALSGAGESRSWTSPPTAVGIAVDFVAAHLAGLDLDAITAARLAALILLPIALVVVWWRSRPGDPLAGAALALMVVIFLAPITQPWYLIWPLALYAVTAERIRWLTVVVIVSMFFVLPDGNGAWKYAQVPLAFAVTGLVGWVAWRAVRWLRAEIRTETPCPASTG